jgi:hypothetical protein
MNELKYLPAMSNKRTSNGTLFRFPGGIEYQKAEANFTSGGRRKTQRLRKNRRKTTKRR